MSTTSQSPAPTVVIDTLRQAFLARAVFTAVELGIPEALATGPRSSDELGAALSLAPVPLHQVLRTLASLGLFASVPDGVGTGRRFVLTDDGRTLLPDHPSGARDLVRALQGPSFAACVAVLPERVRTGRTGPEIALDAPFFEHLATHPDEAAAFDRMMTALHAGDFDAVLPALVPLLCDAHLLVDVGGGAGELAGALLRALPELQATIFDLDQVVAGTAARIAAAGLGTRCDVVAGDFFACIPTGADAYLLSYVLHDWTDDDAVRILSRVAAAMPPSARLFIVEMVLPDDDSPHPGRALDMVMATMTSGLERSAAEYRDIVARAGLHVEQVLPTAGRVQVVVATHPA